MKAAILVDGEFREMGITIDSWKFLKEIDCDVYVSTWDKSTQINKSLDIHIEEDINEDYVRGFFPNAIISINNINDYDFSSDTYFNNAKQIFHWKNCLKMMKESGINYDVVILTRPDNYLFYKFDSSKFFELNKEKTLYGQDTIHVSGPNKQYFMLEYFFIGSVESMSRMIENLPDEMTGSIHTDLALHFLSMDMYVHPIYEFSLILARPTLRGIENLTMEIINEKFWEWGQNTNNRV
jgi:hypothetical protein